MISAWWLCLIVPMSVAFGVLLSCLMFAAGRDDHEC